MICIKCGKFIDDDSKFCTFCGQKIIAQIDYTGGDLEPFCQNSKWGYKDKNTRDVVVSPKYSAITEFAEKRAIVIMGKIYSIVNENGKELVPFKYDFISEFENGYSRVKRDNLWALLDIDCKQLTPFIYESIGSFVKEVAKVKINGKWALIDKLGQQITDEYDEIFDFENSVAKVKQDNLFGLIDDSGKEILVCKFDHVFDFEKDVAKARISNEYILINKAGVIMTKKGYDEIFDFENSVAKVKQGVFFGLIDDSGKEILPCDYHSIFEFENRIAQVTKFHKHGFVNLSGEKIIPCKYEKVIVLAHDAFAVKSHEGWTCLNSQGKDVSQSDANFESFIKRKKRRTRTRKVILLLSILILLVIFVSFEYSTGKFGLENGVRRVFYAEEIAWEDVMNSSGGNTTSMENYIAKYPNGKYLEHVQVILTNTGLANEKKLWTKSLKENTVQSFNWYIAQYPEGTHTVEAKKNIVWIKIRNSKKVKYFNNFLREYPGDKRAIHKIKQLEWRDVKLVLAKWEAEVLVFNTENMIELTFPEGEFYDFAVAIKNNGKAYFKFTFSEVKKYKESSNQIFFNGVMTRKEYSTGVVLEWYTWASAKRVGSEFDAENGKALS